VNSIAKAFEALFERQEWRFFKTDENNYAFGFNSEVNRFNLHATIEDQRHTLTIYSQVPFQVPPGRMSEIAELVSRANWNMILGNFELDYDDGEIRFKISQSFRFREPDPDEIMELLDCALSMMQVYYTCFGDVIYGGQTVEEALSHM